MDISSDQIRQLATLARLELTEAEVEKLSGQLPNIVEYVSQLQQIDTTAVPTPIQVPVALRHDTVEASPVVHEILEQAPERVGDSWKVDAVFS